MKLMSRFQCLAVDDDKKKKKINRKDDDGKVIKVLRADGEISLYHNPIMASDLMTEDFMVCRSDSFYIGHKIPPLSQHDRLLPGHTYFLLPAHLFHSVLSFVTIATSFTNNSSALKIKSTSSCSPFDIQKTPSGSLRIRVSELFISQLLMAAKDDDDDDLLCTTPQLHREYKQLVVGSRRSWKPKLEMIKETPQLKGRRKKIKLNMILSASISRIKTKMTKTSSSTCSLKNKKRCSCRKKKKKPSSSASS